MLNALKISAVLAIGAACLFWTSGQASAGGLPATEQKIVYHCRGDQNAGGGFDICSVNPDGTGYQRLTNEPTEDSWPRISPDGGLIVWRRDGTNLWIMDSDGSNKRELLPEINAHFGSPTWSPDRNTIAFVCNDPDDLNTDGICITDRDGTFFEMVHEVDPRPTYIEWSPVDPNMLLVELETQSINTDIFTFNMQSGVMTNITNTPAEYEHGTWSPDGTEIAFVGSPLPEDQVSLVSLYKIDPDGSDRELLFTSDWSATATGPAWSPEGDRIAYFCSHTDVGAAEICIVDPQGGALVDLLEEGVTDQYYLGNAPDWGFTGGPIFGDLDCDGDVDGDDMLLLLQAADGFNPEAPCILLTQNVDVNGVARPFGDLDCNGVFDARDALPILLSMIGLPKSFADCPIVGQVAHIIAV